MRARNSVRHTTSRRAKGGTLQAQSTKVGSKFVKRVRGIPNVLKPDSETKPKRGTSGEYFQPSWTFSPS
eukprot:2672009-Rhodomonas_salina.2